MDLQALPEGCIANILSLTTPLDAGRLSLISRTFCSAAQSDSVWERFLPSDLESIISDSHQFSSLIAAYPSKKALYLHLSDHPLLIDHGRKSFQLDKRTGKKCYMIAARDLTIIWGSTPEYWEWITLPESRFKEVAKLLAMIDAHGFHLEPAELTVGIVGGISSTKSVCLDPNVEERHLGPNFQGLERPKERSDGWLEIEMGDFFNLGLEDEVEMRVIEIDSKWWKHGFFLQGIEVRPKIV
ncbi:F-box protein [Arachis hypogaea]|nr:F-box protein [Arachis hypogaea]